MARMSKPKTGSFRATADIRPTRDGGHVLKLHSVRGIPRSAGAAKSRKANPGVAARRRDDDGGGR
jgi:hypothetical protein